MHHTAILTVILTALLLPVQFAQDFTDLLLNEYGSSTDENTFSDDDVSKLLNRVLDGHMYNSRADLCENASCPSNAVSYV